LIGPIGREVMQISASVVFPRLTRADPLESSEGNLDPLGLYAIADALGVRLAPGVRERQSHPRYLTAMAVAAHVCEQFDPDLIAQDGVSPPWQVFEWYMVEALVREESDPKRLTGLPGRDKVSTAIRNRVPLSARSYLKTPTVFGFHGVYRLLAKTLDVVRDDRLGELGYKLVAAWEEEQELDGFLTRDREPGRAYFDTLHAAVRDGLARGSVDRQPGWSGWSFFHRYLHPAEFGRREKKLIAQALGIVDEPIRSEVLNFVTSAQGQSAWSDRSERSFHEALRRAASPALAKLLDSIMLYDCLHALASQRRAVVPSTMQDLDGVVSAARELPKLYPELSDRLNAFGLTPRFEGAFDKFAGRYTPREWVPVLFAHHRQVQTNKPPNGRAPWLDWFDGGAVMVRPGYARESGGRHDNSYVHAYRTTPLHSFAVDLGLV
jgi:hypothetical protein